MHACIWWPAAGALVKYVSPWLYTCYFSFCRGPLTVNVTATGVDNATATCSHLYTAGIDYIYVVEVKAPNGTVIRTCPGPGTPLTCTFKGLEIGVDNYEVVCSATLDPSADPTAPVPPPGNKTLDLM